MRSSTFILMALTLVACKKKPDAPDMMGGAVGSSEEKPAREAAVREMVANFERVYFDFDSDALGGESKDALKANADIMKEHTTIELEIQGHADERGTTDYNIALGQRRAKAVQDYLVGMGVPTSRVRTVSYGEERPAATGSSETAWSKNRRAEFRIMSGADGKVEGTTN